MKLDYPELSDAHPETLRFIADTARGFFLSEGQLPPVIYHFRTNEKLEVLFPLTVLPKGTPKNAYKDWCAALMVDMARLPDTVAVAFSTESWLLTGKPKDYEAFKRRDTISDHPDREECLLITYGDHEGNDLTAIARIKRKKNKTKLSAWMVMMDIIEGRFVKIFERARGKKQPTA